MFLVTGGTGFIGSHLLEKLRAEGIAVRCLVRRAQRAPRYLSDWPIARMAPRRLAGIPAGTEIATVDWATGEGLEAALAGVDTVIHLAGVTKALAPADYYAGNVGVTESLARSLAGRPIRFVHVSSLAAMGPSPGGLPIDEDAPQHPLTNYGKSKLEAERRALHWRPDAVIVRPPVVYGPRDTDVFQILKSISRGVRLEISGGERWFSAIYAEDLAEGLMAAARAGPQAAGRAYFLAHPKPVSWSEFASVAAGIMDRHPRVVRIPPGAARAAGFCAELWARATGKPGILSREKVAEACCQAWTCDPGRAARELGFQAATPLESGLARTLAWYREAGWIPY